MATSVDSETGPIESVIVYMDSLYNVAHAMHQASTKHNDLTATLTQRREIAFIE